MKLPMLALLALSLGQPASAADPAYVKEIQEWRDAREKRLRADNGWLTLAGRFPLKAGASTFGTGKDNDVVFPPELKGVGPARLGTIQVDADAKRVTVRPAAGVELFSGDKPFTDERAFDLAAEKPDWVGLGRLRFHVIVRDGKYVLRLADNESVVRRKFAGCVWYAPDERYKVEATFVPYPAGKTIRVANVLDEITEQPCPGYATFTLNGTALRLDAIAEGEGCSSSLPTRPPGTRRTSRRGSSRSRRSRRTTRRSPWTSTRPTTRRAPCPSSRPARSRRSRTP